MSEREELLEALLVERFRGTAADTSRARMSRDLARERPRTPVLARTRRRRLAAERSQTDRDDEEA